MQKAHYRRRIKHRIIKVDQLRLPFRKTYPAGVCCQEFATIIQKAEIVAPTRHED